MPQIRLPKLKKKKKKPPPRPATPTPAPPQAKGPPRPTAPLPPANAFFATPKVASKAAAAPAADPAMAKLANRQFGVGNAASKKAADQPVPGAQTDAGAPDPFIERQLFLDEAASGDAAPATQNVPPSPVVDAAQNDAAALPVWQSDAHLAPPPNVGTDGLEKFYRQLEPVPDPRGAALYALRLVSEFPSFEGLTKLANWCGISPGEAYDAALALVPQDVPTLPTLFKQLGLDGTTAAFNEANAHWTVYHYPADLGYSAATQGPKDMKLWETTLGKWARAAYPGNPTAAATIALNAADAWWVEESGEDTWSPDWYRQRTGNPAPAANNAAHNPPPQPASVDEDQLRRRLDL